MTSTAPGASTASSPIVERLCRGGGVYLLVAAYFAINLIVRLLQPAALESDEGQQIFLTQWLAAGYDNQPPFYTWLQYGVAQLFGSTVLAVALLKNLMLFFCYLLFGMTAQLIIRDRVLAVITTLSLITIPQIAFEMQRDLTHTVGVLFAATLFFYFVVRTLLRPTVASFAMLGLAVGLGTIAKYNFVLLPASVIIAIWWDQSLRRRLLDGRILIAALVALAVVAPHAHWAIGHTSLAAGSHIDKLSFENGMSYTASLTRGLASLARVLATTTLPALAAYWIVFGGKLKLAWPAHSMWTRLVGRTLIVATIFLLAIVLIGASQMKGRWLVPYFFLFPLYLGLKLDAAFPNGADWSSAARRFAVILIAVMVLIPAFLFARVALVGPLGSYKKLNVPYGLGVTQILTEAEKSPSLIVVATPDLAGNVKLHSGDIPVITPGYEWDGGVGPNATGPVLVFWRNGQSSPDAKIPAEVESWLTERGLLSGDAPVIGQVAAPYHYAHDGDMYYFGYAWIYPKAVPDAPG